MWKLTPQPLAERPHIETITTLCQPLHGDNPVWQSLREAVTAIDSRKALSERLERRDGSVVDCTTVPLPAGATLVTFHDVTNSVNVERALRERNEALEDADRIKIAFVHHVSYELRSPLTNIIGFVHLLGRSGDRRARAETARISRLHHGVLEYAAGADQQHSRSGHHRCRPHAAQSRLGRHPRNHAGGGRGRAGSPGQRRASRSTSGRRPTSAASSPTRGACGRFCSTFSPTR